MRLIDADALQRRICGAKCGCEYEDCVNEGDCSFDHFIFHAPTVDAVEVVRCEKCRYCYPVGSIPLCGANGYFAPIPYDIKTHFCRFGERMVEDAD